MTAPTPLLLYTAFHLNLAYSAIEVEQREEVIQRCYWPLLQLARETRVPLGIEASGYTLEVINSIDPEWIKELRRLITDSQCDFIGSGYAQIIGPLVPAEVNAANLSSGQEIYQRLLGIEPQLALVNEQAYSAGLVGHYLRAGYRALIMEWNNAARYHPDWPLFWRYLPQRACGPEGELIPVIWNDTIAFQKFQRYAHGLLDLDEYLEYLTGHLPGETQFSPHSDWRAFSVYANDAEIFDFRPRRYATEGDIHPEGEWRRLKQLLLALKQDFRFEMVRPSRILELLDLPQAGQKVHLESPEQPIVVKKQEKYNVTRWAVTGRDDLGINSACWRLYRALKARPENRPELWKKLCYLWSSDFRTHITEARWQDFQRQLAEAEDRWGAALSPTDRLDLAPENAHPPDHSGTLCPTGFRVKPSAPAFEVQRQGRLLIITSPAVKVGLNCSRGLAIDSLLFQAVSREPLLGTLPHGYYEDISLGADFYSGNTIIEIPGRRRITDLSPTEPQWLEKDTVGGAALKVWAQVPMDLGWAIKEMLIYRDTSRIDLKYSFNFSEPIQGTCRTGILTICPTALTRPSLFYRTHNGGYAAESFPLAERLVHHTEPASVLVSAKHGLGATEGLIEIGDGHRSLVISFDPAVCAAMPMVLYRELHGTFFCRLFFSLGEIDETRCWHPESFCFLPTSLRRESCGSPKTGGFGLDAWQYHPPDNQGLSLSLTITGENHLVGR